MAQGERTRERIIEAATRRFAREGFIGARLDDIAADAGVTRGGVLKHFGSKDDLFFEAYRVALMEVPSYFDAPTEIMEQGFFATYRWWLEHEYEQVEEDFDSSRLLELGLFSVEPPLAGRIKQLWLSEDPPKTVDFVEFGIDRGELQSDLDPYIVAVVLDWLEEGLLRSIVNEDLDRAGLFHHRPDIGRRRDAAIDFIDSMLRSAIAAESASPVPSD